MTIVEVLDAAVGSGPRDDHLVLICEPTPLSARRALDAVAELNASAVVLSDEPQGLAVALDSLSEGRMTLPLRVVELARRMPPLTERQLVILASVAAGQSNAEIARALALSTQSVKRELGIAYQLVGGSDRGELIDGAIALGLEPAPLDCRPEPPTRVGAARSSAHTRR